MNAKTANVEGERRRSIGIGSCWHRTPTECASSSGSVLSRSIAACRRRRRDSSDRRVDIPEVSTSSQRTVSGLPQGGISGITLIKVSRLGLIVHLHVGDFKPLRSSAHVVGEEAHCNIQTQRWQSIFPSEAAATK